MSAPPPVAIAVLGIGNILLGDEGIGIHAMKAFAATNQDLAALSFIDGGTLSFSLAAEIDDQAGLIVLDAAELSAPAGAVRVFEGAAMDTFLGTGRKRSVHEVGLLDLMAITALTGRLPEHRALIAVQPATIDWLDEPTAPVAAAIPEICIRARELVERWRR